MVGFWRGSRNGPSKCAHVVTSALTRASSTQHASSGIAVPAEIVEESSKARKESREEFRKAHCWVLFLVLETCCVFMKLGMKGGASASLGQANKYNTWLRFHKFPCWTDGLYIVSKLKLSFYLTLHWIPLRHCWLPSCVMHSARHRSIEPFESVQKMC